MFMFYWFLLELLSCIAPVVIGRTSVGQLIVCYVANFQILGLKSQCYLCLWDVSCITGLRLNKSLAVIDCY